MTIASSLRFLYTFGGSGLLCAADLRRLLFCQNVVGNCPPPPPFIEAPDIKFMQAQENLFIQSSNKDLNVLQNLNCLSYMIPVFNHHFTDVSDLGYDLNTI